MSDDISRSVASAVSQAVRLSTKLHRVSQSHQLASPLPQVQRPSPQRVPLRLRLLKRHVYVFAFRRSCCISLETRLFLKIVNTLGLDSDSNDPRPQMIPRPEMIPKLDRKWSPAQKWSRCGPQMIPLENEKWHGICGSSGRSFNF